MQYVVMQAKFAFLGERQVLGIHTLSYPEENQGLWCGEAPHDGGCTPENETPIFDAWQVCAH